MVERDLNVTISHSIWMCSQSTLQKTHKQRTNNLMVIMTNIIIRLTILSPIHRNVFQSAREQPLRVSKLLLNLN